jgi:hypothetical protein
MELLCFYLYSLLAGVGTLCHSCSISVISKAWSKTTDPFGKIFLIFKKTGTDL